MPTSRKGVKAIGRNGLFRRWLRAAGGHRKPLIWLQLIRMKIETTTISRLLFFLLCGLLVFTTLAYGAVHQPIIAIAYLIVAIAVILWAVDSLRTGVFKFSRTALQVPILLTVVYALIQIVPFGSIAEIGGLSGIRRTISLEPFWTQMFALHLLALFLYFAMLAGVLDSAARIRRLTTLITVFGFLFAFFAIIQYVLSPTKIYGIYEAQHAAQPFGSFVNRHNFAAFMEMAMAVPLGMFFAGAVPRDKRLITLTAIGLMGVSLIMSGSPRRPCGLAGGDRFPCSADEQGEERQSSRGQGSACGDLAARRRFWIDLHRRRIIPDAPRRNRAFRRLFGQPPSDLERHAASHLEQPSFRCGHRRVCGGLHAVRHDEGSRPRRAGA